VYSCIRVTDEAEIVEVTFHGLDLEISILTALILFRLVAIENLYRHYIRKVLLDIIAISF